VTSRALKLDTTQYNSITTDSCYPILYQVAYTLIAYDMQKIKATAKVNIVLIVQHMGQKLSKN